MAPHQVVRGLYFLCRAIGYSTYAAELVLALVEETRWKSRTKQSEFVHGLRRAIFVDVSVAISHFFDQISSVAEAERAEFDRKQAEEVESDSASMNILSAALRLLAERDFSNGISQAVPAKMEGARRDFNITVETLRDVLSRINTAAEFPPPYLKPTILSRGLPEQAPNSLPVCRK
ncbi:hypothetical protein [Rhizobium sullae]|uniref:hypothetical protein n=1 Tax=Rhizobium sullae TaxID=50338 RepID=UPI000B3545BD|nr:hypothetical protein [Rhizobium sullae]